MRNRPSPVPIKAREKGETTPFREAVLIPSYFEDGRDAVRFRNTVDFIDARKCEIRREP